MTTKIESSFLELIGASKEEIRNKTGIGSPVFYVWNLEGKPIDPPSTFEAASQLLPDGWFWERRGLVVHGKDIPVFQYTANKGRGAFFTLISVECTGNEIYDRLNLAYEVARWLRDNSPSDFKTWVEKARKVLSK